MKIPHAFALAVQFALFPTFSTYSIAHEGEEEHSHEQHANESFFTTRPNALVLPLAKEDDAFHFIIYGDRTGGVPAGLKVLEQAVVDTNLLDPDLVMTVGDLIQGYNETPEWLRQMNEYKEIMNRLKMKWFPVAGNHDVYWRGVGKVPEGQHESNYEKHFGPLWYTFQHKNAGFIVLYSDEGDSTTNEKGFNEGRLQTMSQEQLAFLRQALDQHKNLDHVFLFLHHPRWIGGGYTGGNWDTVHELLKTSGNVSAVFAGHIHQLRYDGSKDGIEYHTLATTGGALDADFPDAGYLHHMNIVTVRPETVTVASLPVGAVIDPKEFTPEFLAEIDNARSIRPVEKASDVVLQIDGSANGKVTMVIANTTSQTIEATASFDSDPREWTASLDHDHISIAPGESTNIEVKLSRQGTVDAFTTPRVRLDMQYVGKTARINLPPVITPISFDVAAVPADFFRDGENRCLEVTGESTAARIDSAEFELPDGPFTLETWMNPSQSAGQRGLIAKTESSEYAIFMDEGVPQFDVHLNGRYVSAVAKDVLPLNHWTHLAGVFTGSEVRIYIDGKLTSAKPGKGKRTRNRLPLFLGADTDESGQATRSFLGKVDEVRLSQGVKYDGDFVPSRRFTPDEDTVLLYHFDRRFGPFLLDHSVSAAKATLGLKSSLVPVE
jgi:Concanavalin A-like lectin/glucanases superfamily/Calcineurin-like phosphoesterase